MLPGFLPASIRSFSVLYLVAVATTNGMLASAADRGEIVGHVERQLGVGRCHHHVRGRVHQHRVAVGLGLGDHAGAERGAGAAAVFDHEGLAELPADLFEHGAGGDVGSAAGRERHHDLDRLLGGPVLRRGGMRPGKTRTRSTSRSQQRVMDVSPITPRDRSDAAGT